MKICPINKEVADLFTATKHYSRRPSIFWAGFGLEIDHHLEGIVVYGQPSPPIQRHAFRDRDFRLYELSRLVIQTPRRNAASFLVGNSLKMLERPCAVVSYADTAWNHTGYVYQATNWHYTGSTVSHDSLYRVGDETLHPMTIRDRFGVTDPKEWADQNGIERVPPKPKHRYFYFLGSKKERRIMREKLNYPILPEYPKAEPQRYEDGPTLKIRTSLPSDIDFEDLFS